MALHGPGRRALDSASIATPNGSGDEVGCCVRTIARLKLKPGAFERLDQQMAGIHSDLTAAGWRSTTVYRSDSDPNEVWLAVVFESKEAYRANAESPEQGARYEQMRALLEADPEWHDGEVVSNNGA